MGVCCARAAPDDGTDDDDQLSSIALMTPRDLSRASQEPLTVALPSACIAQVESGTVVRLRFTDGDTVRCRLYGYDTIGDAADQLVALHLRTNYPHCNLLVNVVRDGTVGAHGVLEPPQVILFHVRATRTGKHRGFSCKGVNSYIVAVFGHVGVRKWQSAGDSLSSGPASIELGD